MDSMRMLRLSKTMLLFIVILIEGYVVLASELLAIRQLIPFVGSGTEIIAVIISAVLLPLAMGYHAGGRFRGPVRKRLLRNIFTALTILSVGLSYLFLELIFTGLYRAGLTQPIVQTALYCMTFIAFPVFLLGQTVPLVSNYFGRRRLSEITGRMLFFSTVGSFMGSVFSTLVLMNTIGVHATVIVTLCLLALLVPLLMRRLFTYEGMVALLIAGAVVAANSPATMKSLKIVSNNAYNLVMVGQNEKNGNRFFYINRSISSGLSKDGKRIFPYAAYIERIFIDPIAKKGSTPRDILIIGAGGFTIGLEDTVNRYTFVDIDPALKDVAEAHFLPAKLGPNKQFVAASARAFVHLRPEQYDLILVDCYTNTFAVPMESITREFLLDVKKHLRPDGVLIVNQLSPPNFADRYSVRYHNVFSSVFPAYTRQVIDDYNPWEAGKSPENLRNILYIFYNRQGVDDTTTYTDDKNTYSLDRY